MSVNELRVGIKGKESDGTQPSKDKQAQLGTNDIRPVVQRRGQGGRAPGLG